MELWNRNFAGIDAQHWKRAREGREFQLASLQFANVKLMVVEKLFQIGQVPDVREG